MFELVVVVFVLWICYKFCDWIIRIPMLKFHDRRYPFTRRYILITGCDSGFGHAVSKKLALKGYNVFAACLTKQGKQALDATENIMVQLLLKTFQMDVSDEASVEAGFQYVKHKLPTGVGLWGVVNNAGVPGLVGPAEWLTKANYQSVLDVNLLGLIHVTTTFLPLVKKREGRIVNVASMLGRTTLMGSTPYGVSKYGVEAFSDSLRRQLKPFNVSVHLIEPGFFRTSMADPVRIEGTLRQAWDQCTPETQREYGEHYLEESIKFVIRSMVGGLVSDRVDYVHDAITHALLGVHPRARYVVGLDARLVLLPIQCLPEWLGDWLHELMARGRPLPAAVS